MQKPEYPLELIEYGENGKTAAWFIAFVVQDPAEKYGKDTIHIASLLSANGQGDRGHTILTTDQIISRTVLSIESKP